MSRQVVVICALVSLACSNKELAKEQTPKGPVVTASSDRPECGDSLAIPMPDRGTLTSMPLAGPISSVPEYHDCQPLVSGAAGDYGPLVAIYAAYHLDSIYKSPRFQNTQELTPVAELYSYDGDYPRLGIRQGFNCLEVRRKNGRWTASMRATGQTQPDCTKVNPSDISTVLTVSDEPMPKAVDADYPPVARWDWDAGDGVDPTTAHQYIGIKCGTSWCSVGAEHPRPTPPTAGEPEFGPMPNRPAPTQLKRDRVSQIKGWYDEQYLADIGPAGKPHRGPILAQVYPHPQNDEVNNTADFGAVWRPSAVVVLPVGTHYDKLHLGPGRNTIYLCQGSGCGGVPTTKHCPASEDGLTWYARINPAAGRVEHTCVTRRSHTNIEIPATTRWRWVNSDEKVWIRCASGCCTVQ